MPKSPASPPPGLVVQQEEESSFDLDPSDIFVGVLLAVIIPAAVYIGLGVIGMPVSGVKGTDFSGALAAKEKEKNRIKKVIPLEPEEFKDRMDWTTTLLRVRVPEYLKRAQAESDATIVDNWIRCAKTVVGNCEAELNYLQDGIQNNPNFAKDLSYAQQVSSRMSSVQELRTQIARLDPFSSVRGSD